MQSNQKRSLWVPSLVVAALLCVLFLTSLLAGAVPVHLGDIARLWQNQSADHIRTILWEIRLPRILAAALIGGALGTAGAVFQSLFRNPLADPFVIGASSGAALGATIVIAVVGIGSGGFAAELGVAGAAFLGTVATVILVFLLGGRSWYDSAISLLLAGTAISTFLGSIVSLLMLLNDKSLQIVYYWLLGGLGGTHWSHLGTLAVVTIPAALAVYRQSRKLDALALGDASAYSLGLQVGLLRAGLIVLASLLTAASVAVGGIIGFVGLIPPHIARGIFGGQHRVSLPGSAAIGACLLVLADTIARSWMAPQELPVGIITSLIGAPFFLYLLYRGRRRLD